MCTLVPNVWLQVLVREPHTVPAFPPSIQQLFSSLWNYFFRVIPIHDFDNSKSTWRGKKILWQCLTLRILGFQVLQKRVFWNLEYLSRLSVFLLKDSCFKSHISERKKLFLLYHKDTILIFCQNKHIHSWSQGCWWGQSTCYASRKLKFRFFFGDWLGVYD